MKGPLLLVLWLFGSLFCIASGPFGTQVSFELWERAVYWPLVVGLSILVGGAVRAFVHGVLYVPNPVFQQIWVSVLVSVILSPMLVWLAAVFVGPGEQTPGLFRMFGYVLMVSGVISAIVLAVAAQQSSSATEESVELGGARLMTRISPDLRAPIQRMQVRDHYVEVVTGKGREMLLIRFADALSEVASAEGMQVHRSHWVAREAMTGIARDRGRIHLLLNDGTEVPVSRTYLSAVEALGLENRARAAAE